MYVPGPRDPISVYYRVDSKNNIYAGIVHTTILFRVDHSGNSFMLVCRQCLNPLHNVGEEDRELAHGVDLRCWSPTTRSKRPCPEADRLGPQAKLGLQFYPRDLSPIAMVRSLKQQFPRTLLENYTRAWRLFEQTFTLMDLEADVRAAVPQIHASIEVNAGAKDSLLEQWFLQYRNRNVSSVLSKLEKTYYPQVSEGGAAV